jgi:hypothetical protein
MIIAIMFLLVKHPELLPPRGNKRVLNVCSKATIWEAR